MLAVAVAVTVFALTVAGCDADGDGYDDETGEALPVSVSYSWEGRSATYWDGQRAVTRETPSGFGSANAVVQPGHNASITVRGTLASCQVVSGSHKIGGDRGGSVHCGLTADVLWR